MNYLHKFYEALKVVYRQPLKIGLFLPRQENADAKQSFLNLRQQNSKLRRLHDFFIIIICFYRITSFNSK